MLTLCSKRNINHIGFSKRFLSLSSSQQVPISNFEPSVSLPYNKLVDNLSVVREKLNRTLSLSEKILYSHIADPASVDDIIRGESFLKLNPDRLAMPDSSSQIALLQFISTGLHTVQLPSTIHCDHLIEAHSGAASDLESSNRKNVEINNFLISAAKKYGIGLWKPNSGIIHQIVLENYAFPGGYMIGTDSHTPNAGGLSMVGIGVIQVVYTARKTSDTLIDIYWHRRKQMRQDMEIMSQNDGFLSIHIHIYLLMRMFQLVTVSHLFTI